MSLTEREKEILYWVSEGKTCFEIGKILDLSPSTINNYRASLHRKLDVHKDVQLVLCAIRLGLLDPFGQKGDTL